MASDKPVFEKQGLSHFVMRGDVNGRRTKIEWHGGPYIEVMAPGTTRPHEAYDQYGHRRRWSKWATFEVWNVWDYADGEPDIPVTMQAFRRYVRDKLADPEVLENFVVSRRETFYPEVV